MMLVRHARVSAEQDEPLEPELIQPSDWNNPHVIEGEPEAVVMRCLAAVAISGHVAVVVGASGVRAADVTAAADVLAVAGVTVGAADAGEYVGVMVAGKLSGVSPLLSHGPVYVGNGGVLSQVVPGGAAFVQIMGMADGAGGLVVSMRDPILIG